MEATPPLQVQQTIVDPEVIDLGIGNPPPSVLPLERIRRATETQLRRPERDFLQYGAEMGDGYLHRALAGFLREWQFSTAPL